VAVTKKRIRIINNNILNKETLLKVAAILGDGYSCFANAETGEVFTADEIDLEARKADHIKEFTPIDSTTTFAIMQDYTATVDDFEKQSELMEILLYDQPFLNFKRKVYAVNLAEEWLAYRAERIATLLAESA
jgi:hypothetical protein